MGESAGLTIVLAGVRVFCLGMLALLSLPCDSSGGAVNFGLSGFQENSLYLVPDSNWILNTTTACFHFNAAGFDLLIATSGRFLYPDAVQMIDPGSTTVKSFSTSFIYQLQIVSTLSHLGPGLAFIIVPDNVTLGAPGDFMGLVTNETSETAKNYESDDHTLGVELDAYMNPGFNDTNNNHIGINLASMNSTFSFEPGDSLASSSADLYQQIWIDYFEADSRMDISYAPYGQDKPAKPQGSQSGLNLSLLKENMYIGFSTANKIGSFDVPYVCAWSFSNNGTPAPPIVIAQDATPGAPPPPGPVPPAPPPNGPVAAPSLPPPAWTPSPPPVPTRSPAPGISSPSPPPASNLPPLRAPNPSPLNPPSPPTPSSVPSRGPNGEPPTIRKKGGKKKKLGIDVGVPVAVLLFFIIVGLCILILRCRRRFLNHPLHIFLSHAGGRDGSGKNFSIFLHDRMTKYRWSVSTLSNITFFIDKENIPDAEPFAEKIFAELARSDVGLVVVTDDFFRSKWPMTELIAFVEAHTDDPTRRLRVLPLFYMLKPDDVRRHLTAKTWEPDWNEWNTGKHPLVVEKCRDAVTFLCKWKGILYRSEIRDYDKEYIEDICKRLDKILRKEKNFPAYLWGAIKSFRVPRPRMTGIHESEMVSP